jgi:transcriptional regulator with XRE-family HTH domain
VGINLDDLLGIDPSDPKVIALREDRSRYHRLIKTLVSLRKEQGLSQSDVAAEMETSQSVVSAFEQAVNDARFSTVQRYARAVGAHLQFMSAIDGGVHTERFTVHPVNDEVDTFYRQAVANG